jgi:hypothetical protein
MAQVWHPALAPLLKGHPAHIEFIKSVTEFLLIASCHFNTNTMLKYLQDALGGISSNIHLFLPYCKSHSMSKIPKSVPFCTISNILATCALPITVTLKYREAITNTSSGMVTVTLTLRTIFCRCYDGIWIYFLSSRQSVFYCISLNYVPYCGKQLYTDSFLWGILCCLTYCYPV